MLMRTLVQKTLGIILARTLSSNLAILKIDNNIFNNYRSATGDKKLINR